jgi:hypothetical protein
VRGDRRATIGKRNWIVEGMMPATNQKPYFFSSLDLKEMPSRIAIFLTDSGFRPVAFAASSNDFEARASSIKKRCSANDQPDFRTIPEMNFVIRSKPPSGVCSPGDFAVVGPDLGTLSGSQSIVDLRKLATNAVR